METQEIMSGESGELQEMDSRSSSDENVEGRIQLTSESNGTEEDISTNRRVGRAVELETPCDIVLPGGVYRSDARNSLDVNFPNTNNTQKPHQKEIVFPGSIATHLHNGSGTQGDNEKLGALSKGTHTSNRPHEIQKGQADRFEPHATKEFTVTPREKSIPKKPSSIGPRASNPGAVAISLPGTGSKRFGQDPSARHDFQRNESSRQAALLDEMISQRSLLSKKSHGVAIHNRESRPSSKPASSSHDNVKIEELMMIAPIQMI